MKNQPIGIFDSGLGGLTVLKEITALLPKESTLYFGDTARVPYGIKSRETIIRYSKEIANFLTNKNIKMLIIACNSASAHALKDLENTLNIPVVGVIKPGAMDAVNKSKNKNIGIIGTEATIRSKAYVREILDIDPKANISAKACPLFVPLVEENWVNNKVAKDTIEIYLKDLKDKIDTLVLGCTHYPLLSQSIEEYIGKDVEIVNSAKATAKEVERILKEKNILNNSDDISREYFVTDEAEKFKINGTIFLNESLENTSHVDLD